MWDDDDLDFVILAWPTGGGWISFVCGVLVLVGIRWLINRDANTCEDVLCADDAGEVLDVRCICTRADGSMYAPSVAPHTPNHEATP